MGITHTQTSGRGVNSGRKPPWLKGALISMNTIVMHECTGVYVCVCVCSEEGAFCSLYTVMMKIECVCVYVIKCRFAPEHDVNFSRCSAPGGRCCL